MWGIMHGNNAWRTNDSRSTVSIDLKEAASGRYAKYQGFLLVFRALFNSGATDHILCKPIKTLILVALVARSAAISTGFSTDAVLGLVTILQFNIMCLMRH
jgi:hypothetical protein